MLPNHPLNKNLIKLDATHHVKIKHLIGGAISFLILFAINLAI